MFNIKTAQNVQAFVSGMSYNRITALQMAKEHPCLLDAARLFDKPISRAAVLGSEALPCLSIYWQHTDN